MTAHVHALLAGIDAYPSPIPALAGCVNDVRAAQSLLEFWSSRSAGGLSVRVLVNQEATRAAVIEGFREHLGAAAEGDTAVFWFSGHGSQEPSRPEHYALEPDRLNETLVLFDSRLGGENDLADKELALLVAEIAQRGVHVLVILDCCHAGSGVRKPDPLEDTVRQIPPDPRPRSAQDYLELRRGGRLDPDRGNRYVLLAACRPDQAAREIRAPGSRRGVFSFALEQALENAPKAFSYRELHAWVATRLRGLVSDQTPVLESTRPEDADRSFLGGAALGGPSSMTVGYRRRQGWFLDAGVLHGLPAGGSETELDLRSLGSSAETPVAATVRVANATTVASQVEVISGTVDENLVYAATLRRLPIGKFGIRLVGDGSGNLERSLAQSVLARIVDRDETLVVTGGEAEVRITRGRRWPAYPGAGALWAGHPEDAGFAVERIVRWLGVRERDNPLSRLGPGCAEIAVFAEDGTQVPIGSDGVRCPVSASGPSQSFIAVRIRNHSSQRLFQAVLGLGESFGISSLVPGGGEWVSPGEEVWVQGDSGMPRLYLDLPPQADRAEDLLKVMISTREFDAQRFAQPDLVPGAGGDRASGQGEDLPDFADDWATRQVLLTLVRAGS